jgi:hypothetical protein
MTPEQLAALSDASRQAYTAVFDTVTAGVERLRYFDTPAAKAELGPEAIRRSRTETLTDLDRTLASPMDVLVRAQATMADHPHVFDGPTAARRAAATPVVEWQPDENPDYNRIAVWSDKEKVGRMDAQGALLARVVDELARDRTERNLQRLSAASMLNRLEQATKAGDLRTVGFVLAEADQRDLDPSERSRLSALCKAIDDQEEFTAARAVRSQVEQYTTESTLLLKDLKGTKVGTLRRRIFDHLTEANTPGSSKAA